MRGFDKTLSRLLKLIHLSLDSSHVCLNNFRTYNHKSEMFRPLPSLTIQIIKRDVVIIIEFENANITISISIKSI